MTRKTKTTETENTVEPVAAEPEQHMPIIVTEMKGKIEILKPCFDEALATGKSDQLGDGRMVYALPVPPEAAIVDHPKSKFLYVSFRAVRREERWLPVANLMRAQLNGWQYFDARRLYEPPSLRVFEALEHLYNHGDEPGPLEAYPGGTLDVMAKKMLGLTAVTIDGRIEAENSPGSASKSEWLLYQNSWLPFLTISKIAPHRPERIERNYNPNIRIL
jgi:hypothetical protein